MPFLFASSYEVLSATTTAPFALGLATTSCSCESINTCRCECEEEAFDQGHPSHVLRKEMTPGVEAVESNLFGISFRARQRNFKIENRFVVSSQSCLFQQINCCFLPKRMYGMYHAGIDSDSITTAPHNNNNSAVLLLIQ